MKKIKNSVSEQLTKKIQDIFGPTASKSLQIDYKDDQSLVTDIDHFVSGLIKEELRSDQRFAHYHYFSEEDYGDFHFPCAILDPIDGTRELVKGRAECAVSLALMHSPELLDHENQAWIYNPFSGFSIDSQQPFVATESKSSQKFLALVSRSEYHRGFFQKYMDHPRLDISPRGSIAFKLGLLAVGACDLVVSVAPKNVWDIAAGSVLCAQRGIDFYVDGQKITKLEKEKYAGLLVWATPSVASEIFDSNLKYF